MDAATRVPNGTSRTAALSGVLLPGVYAWSATVAAPAFDHGGLTTVGPALAALLALGAGVALVRRAPRVGRALGVLGFAVLSAATWCGLGDELSVEWLDPWRGGFGALGWLLMAQGWGGLSTGSREPPSEAPREGAGFPLEPRRRLPATIGSLLVAALLGAIGPLAAAWTVTRPEHAFMAHATAVLAAIGMLTVGGTVALTRLTAPVVALPALRLRGAASALTLLVVGLAGGLLWALLA